jgi:hypothetical protein
MQRLLTYSLSVLPTLVQSELLGEDDKLLIKEKLMVGDVRILSAFEVLSNKHGGYVPSQYDQSDLADLAESLRCCLQAEARAQEANKGQTSQESRPNFGSDMVSASVTLVFAAPEMQSVAQEAVNSSNGQLALGRIQWNRFDTANG